MERKDGDERIILGSNYWPGEKGVYWWREFELLSLRRDFSLAAEYGLDRMHVFLLWEDFQPEINRVSVAALKNLVRVADLANDHRIKILPVFFCGNMIGVSWLSPLDGGERKGRQGVSCIFHGEEEND